MSESSSSSSDSAPHDQPPLTYDSIMAAHVQSLDLGSGQNPAPITGDHKLGDLIAPQGGVVFLVRRPGCQLNSIDSKEKSAKDSFANVTNSLLFKSLLLFLIFPPAFLHLQTHNWDYFSFTGPLCRADAKGIAEVFDKLVEKTRAQRVNQPQFNTSPHSCSMLGCCCHFRYFPSNSAASGPGPSSAASTPTSAASSSSSAASSSSNSPPTASLKESPRLLTLAKENLDSELNDFLPFIQPGGTLLLHPDRALFKQLGKKKLGLRDLFSWKVIKKYLQDKKVRSAIIGAVIGIGRLGQYHLEQVNFLTEQTLSLLFV